MVLMFLLDCYVSRVHTSLLMDERGKLVTCVYLFSLARADSTEPVDILNSDALVYTRSMPNMPDHKLLQELNLPMF